MENIISKELLTAVLKEVKGIEFERFQQNKNYIGIEVIEGKYCHGTNYNINHVAHMCKEWAFAQKDFILQSAFVPKGKFTSCYCIAEKNFSYPTMKETFHADTEHESIFKACQWILDNKDATNGRA